MYMYIIEYFVTLFSKCMCAIDFASTLSIVTKTINLLNLVDDSEKRICCLS